MCSLLPPAWVSAWAPECCSPLPAEKKPAVRCVTRSRTLGTKFGTRFVTASPPQVGGDQPAPTPFKVSRNLWKSHPAPPRFVTPRRSRFETLHPYLRLGIRTSSLTPQGGRIRA